MNYERIYNKFISNRRIKESETSKDKYTELHHIKPKCMGGDDKKENLIRLTPEDHFFAHLLLAKSFGGKNWLALHSMLHRGMKTESISYKDFANKRKQFGFIRRLVAKNFSGRNNSQSDKNIYLFKNKDGSEICGDRYEIAEKTNLTPKSIRGLINGRLKTALNWYYPVLNPNGLSLKIFNDVEKINSLPQIKLYHFDGREWEGTSFDFYKEFGKQLNFYKQGSSCSGWFEQKDTAKEYLNKRLNSSKPQGKFYKFEYIKQKRIVYHSKNSLAKELDISEQVVNDLLLKKIKQIKNVRLLDHGLKKRKALNGTYYKFKLIETGKICNLSIPKMAEEYKIPEERLYQLINGRVKVIKKYGVTLA